MAAGTSTSLSLPDLSRFTFAITFLLCDVNMDRWQMQIELENEFNLISDYAELTQAFKLPCGVAQNNMKQLQDHQSHGSAQGPYHQQARVQGPAPVHPRSAAAPPPSFHDEPTHSPRWEIRTPESKRQVAAPQQYPVVHLHLIAEMS